MSNPQKSSTPSSPDLLTVVTKDGRRHQVAPESLPWGTANQTGTLAPYLLRTQAETWMVPYVHRDGEEFAEQVTVLPRLLPDASVPQVRRRRLGNVPPLGQDPPASEVLDRLLSRRAPSGVPVDAGEFPCLRHVTEQELLGLVRTFRPAFVVMLGSRPSPVRVAR